MRRHSEREQEHHAANHAGARHRVSLLWGQEGQEGRVGQVKDCGYGIPQIRFTCPSPFLPFLPFLPYRAQSEFQPQHRRRAGRALGRR